MTEQLSPKPERKAIGKKVRFEVFKRDRFTCMYCGAHPPAVVLHVDHIHPVASGGGNDIDNLVTACEPCNLGKGARDLTVAPKSLAERAAETIEREEQLAGYQAVMEAKRQRLEDETWRVLEIIFGQVESVRHDDFNSTKRFIDKLGLVSVIECAEIAMGANVPHYRKFRYFCGVCWNRVRETEK